MTPPENPATPPGVPIPYPNTGMAKDTTSGSKKVKISNKEVMLKNKSYFKKSMGDEAGSAAKKGVITSTNRGKVYFTMWSMDVKVESQNVVRHLDLTTHNHMCLPGNTGPWPYLDSMFLAAIEAWSEAHEKCECCGGPAHSSGEKVSMETWYTTDNNGAPIAGQKEKYDAVMKKVESRKENGCTCDGEVVPSPPCDQHYNKTTKLERNAIKRKWRTASRAGDGPGTVRNQIGATSGKKVNHLTPKAAGGCPDAPGNLQAGENLCSVCTDIDDDFTKLQNDASVPSIE